MLEMVDIEYIRKKHLVEGWSIRKISRNLGVSRQSVRKALNSSEIPKYNLSKAKPCPVMEPYKDIILEWLEQDKLQPKKQRLTAHQIYQQLVAQFEFAGSESTVRRCVRLMKNQTGEVFIPLTADWGEQAQADWGKAKIYLGQTLITVSLFCLRLKASLVPFVWAAPTEKLEAFLEGHKRALEWLGGTPRTIVYDNPKTAVTKILKGPYREEHKHFSSLRAHYLFDSEFCNPSRGNEKGTVENLVKFVRKNALVPIPKVESIEELNQKLLDWCNNQRQHRIKEWELEQKELLPLPAQPFKCSTTRMVTSSNLLLFQYDRNCYSVPTNCVRKNLRVEAFTDRIEVYDGSKQVAVHERCYSRGEKIMKLEHYLPVLARKPRAVKNALVVRKLPEVYQKLRRYLCGRDPEGYKEFAKILLLNMEFDFEDVLLAVEESIKLGNPSLETVKQSLILKAYNTKKTQDEIHNSPASHLEIPVDNPSKFNRLIMEVSA
jgi:transposase